MFVRIVARQVIAFRQAVVGREIQAAGFIRHVGLGGMRHIAVEKHQVPRPGRVRNEIHSRHVLLRQRFPFP